MIVILWSRMGTPLPPEYAKPDGKPYLSGTAWEYWDAKQATVFVNYLTGCLAEAAAGVNPSAVELVPPHHGGRLGGGREKGSEATDLTRPLPNPSPMGEGTGLLHSTALPFEGELAVVGRQPFAAADSSLDSRHGDADLQLQFWQGLAEGTLRVTLPSEAEWEYAARGTEARRYPWGNKADPERATYDKTGVNGTSAVGCFPGGVSPFGIEDLSGNVWEWTRSHWDHYPYHEPGENRQQRESLDATENRVLRGGSPYYGQSGIRCAYRELNVPYFQHYGFRVAVSPL